MNRLAQIVRDRDAIPLAWAGSTAKMDYVNLGDALSPVMVALCAGKPIERVPFRSVAERLAAVGTIAHGLEDGTVWIWGSGGSKHQNPGAAAHERRAYQIPSGTEFHIAATRGPITRRLLDGRAPPAGAVYGDPVWLLPRFYRPNVEKKWELGVILHLSELEDRAFEAHARPNLHRYAVPEDFRDDIHLINTVTAIGLDSMRRRIDEILACRRIVSTSLHGMVFAESYGIPCLYFAPNGGMSGLRRFPLDIDSTLDLRIVDLYAGLGAADLAVYVQPRETPTRWDDVIRAIDLAWRPREFDAAALIEAFPLAFRPIAAEPGRTVFDHPVIRSIQLRHDVGELGRVERARRAALAS